MNAATKRSSTWWSLVDRSVRPEPAAPGPTVRRISGARHRYVPAPAARRQLDTIRPGTAADEGVFAEFERAMIQERIMSGLARARVEGKSLGRRRTKGATNEAILELRNQGLGMLAIGRKLGCGTGRVRAVVNGAAALQA